MGRRRWGCGEFPDVAVDQVAGPVAFVAADGPASGPVQRGQRWQLVLSQDAVNSRGGDVAADRDPLEADPVFLAQSYHLFLDAGGGLFGEWCGRLELSYMPSSVRGVTVGPALGSGVTDLEPFGDPPSSTIHQAGRSLPVGVSATLRWHMTASWPGGRCRNHHRTQKTLTHARPHPRHQRARTARPVAALQARDPARVRSGRATPYQFRTDSQPSAKLLPAQARPAPDAASASVMMASSAS